MTRAWCCLFWCCAPPLRVQQDLCKNVVTHCLIKLTNAKKRIQYNWQMSIICKFVSRILYTGGLAPFYTRKFSRGRWWPNLGSFILGTSLWGLPIIGPSGKSLRSMGDYRRVRNSMMGDIQGMGTLWFGNVFCIIAPLRWESSRQSTIFAKGL